MSIDSEKIKRVKQQYEKIWLAHPAVVSIGVGNLSSGRMGIIIGVLKIDTDVIHSIPDYMDGVPIELNVTDTVKAQ